MIEGVGFGRRPLHDAKYTEEAALNAILNEDGLQRWPRGLFRAS